MVVPTASAVPGMDPVAAWRWQQRRHARSPWLQDEVGRRMAERLAWIKQPVQDVLVHMPHGSGQAGVEGVQTYCTQAQIAWPAQDVLPPPRLPWWRRAWLHRPMPAPRAVAADAAEVVDLVWANMSLHVLPQPQAVFAQWWQQLREQGFVMCSGLGPDSLKELRAIYHQMGWPEPAHPLTDMHDWGDMLVQTGFAEPVMDMERMTLAYDHGDKLIDDLRAWGRNLSGQRFEACRGRAYRHALVQALERHMPRNREGQMTLTLEIVYGYAIKPAPKALVKAETAVSLQQMRRMLKPSV